MTDRTPLEERLAAALEARAAQVEGDGAGTAYPLGLDAVRAAGERRRRRLAAGSITAAAVGVAASVLVAAGLPGLLGDDGPGRGGAGVAAQEQGAGQEAGSVPAFYPAATRTLGVGEPLSVDTGGGGVTVSLERVPGDLVLRSTGPGGASQDEVVAYWTDDTVLLAQPLRTREAPAFAVRARDPDGTEVWQLFGYRDGDLTLLPPGEMSFRSERLAGGGATRVWLSAEGVLYERRTDGGDDASGRARVTRAEPDGPDDPATGGLVGSTDLGAWCFAPEPRVAADVTRCG